MPRFIKWDFDAGVGIEYERQGECNGCGACCIDKIKYTHAGTMTEGPGPMGDRVVPRGIWAEYRDGTESRFISLPTRTGIHIPCNLLRDGLCMVHPNKSVNEVALCWTFPIIPEHAALYPKCSYSFVEVSRCPIPLRLSTKQRSKARHVGSRE